MHVDPRSAAWPTLDPQASADVARALVHDAQAQVSGRRADWVEAVPVIDEVQVREPLTRFLRIALPDARHHFGDQTSGEEGLGNGVVQLTGQSLALLGRRDQRRLLE